jgi:uncharacterized protein YkwD
MAPPPGRRLAVPMALLAAAILSLGAGPDTAGALLRCGAAGAAPHKATDHQLRTSVLCLVNRARERHGIAPLAFSPALRQSATAQAGNIARSGSLSHYGPRGSDLAVRASRSGYSGSYRLAENIAAGRGRRHGSPLAILRTWMQSDGHRQNVLDPGLRDFGVGIARGGRLGEGSDNFAVYTLDLGARRG